MHEPQQPQYFDVAAPAPTPVPWWKTWKIALPILGVGIVLLLIVLTVNLLRGEEETANREDALSKMEQALTVCENERDPASCKARVRNDAAKNGAGEDACRGLDDAAYTSCVSLSAKSSTKIEACAVLSEEERTACEDLVYSELGRSEVDSEICERISNQRLRASCQVEVVQNAVAAGTCAEANVDESLCAAQETMRVAIASGDPADCAALANAAEHEECTDGQTSVDDDDDGLTVREEYLAGTSDENADADGDGLSDGDEVQSFNSDPRNPDTDGDGYNDGQEVENGHDPLH